MRWSETVTLDFVKIYLKQEALWNPDHPGYKIKYQREKAYFAISSEFSEATGKCLTVPEVKTKIKNLRTTYVQQVNKILQKSSPDSIYEPSLVWFHEMDRCLKHLPSNKNSSGLSSKEFEVDSSSQIWIDPDPEASKSDDPNPDPLVSQTDDEFLLEQEDLKVKKARTSFKKTKKKKLKRKSLLSFMPAPDSNSSTSLATEDEFDIYGKFIASQLRQMDIQKALRLQLAIQSLVSEARISDLN